MSGTQDTNSAVQNFEELAQQAQAGLENGLDESAQVAETEEQETLSPSQKMDELIRGSSKGFMKKEIEKLRKEAARYRSSSRTEAQQKLEFQAKAEMYEKELDALKKEHRTLALIQKLDKAGCIKSELVAKDVPSDLDLAEGLDEFIEKYKEENSFLFKAPKQNIGSVFKTSGKQNLSPSQQMDAYIRAALGR